MRGRALPTIILVLAFLAAATPAPADEEETARIEGQLRALVSPDARRRADAVVQLMGVTDPAWRDAILTGLVARLDDPHAPIRAQAALALGRRGDPRAAAPLAARLPEELAADVRAALLLALGDLRAEDHVAVVVEAARTAPRPAVRAAALDALGRIGGAAARATLLETLRAPGLVDGDWSLRSAALLGLARAAGPEDVGTVLVLYREGGGAAHWFARSAFARFVAAKDPDGLPVLLKMVGDPDPRVAVTAAEGLARSGNAAHLVRLLSHVVPSVRVAAVSAVGQTRLETAYPRLRTMARLDRSREVRWAAAVALFRVVDPAGDELVLEGLAAREPAVWAEALAVLRERTGESHGRDVEAWRAALLRWRARR